MRISAIQGQVNYQTKGLSNKNSRRVIHEVPQEPKNVPSFKGANGGLIGLGGGMTLVLLGIGASIITGGAALPVLLGGAAVLGGGAAGAKIGSDIEDKITGKKED